MCIRDRYYIHVIAINGKEQYRPMTALEGGVNSFMFSTDECEENTSVFDNDNDFDKKLIKIVDVTGREQKSIIKNKVLFLIFDDGTVEKQFIN